MTEKNMDEIKKIMVAIAFSEHAKNIFDYAAKLATSLNAELLVASIINSRDVEAVESISAMGYDVDGEHYIRNIRNERNQILEQIIGESGFPRERIHTVITVGNPVDELLNITVKEDADMIVMGTKGRTNLRNILIGSVAEKIFRKSPVPVLSYRDEKHIDSKDSIADY